MERWQGKTAVVTGASAGIGAAICVTLAKAGLNVIGLARRPQLIDELKTKVKGKGSIQSRGCDLSKPEDIRAAFKHIESIGGTDILVNCGGVFPLGDITELGPNTLSDTDITTVFDTNVKGLILCARHAVSSMKKRNFDGLIINLNSYVGQFKNIPPYFNVYTATKHAVTAFTTSLHTELSSLSLNKIKVTSLSPGLVDTDLTTAFGSMINYEPLIPQDIADAVLYVVSTPPNVNISELTIIPVGQKIF